MNAQEAASKMIGLFDQYAECFGLCDHQFPNKRFQEQQCEFEEKFNEIVCEFLGHNIGPDQCNKREHDYCYRCSKSRLEIEATSREES